MEKDQEPVYSQDTDLEQDEVIDLKEGEATSGDVKGFRRAPPRDKVMAFWRTMSGKQTRFLTEAGTKKERVAISMAGIAKPTKDFKFNVKTAGKTRIWNGSYEMRQPTGKTTISLGVAESTFPVESLSLGKSWTKDGVALEANCSLKFQIGGETKEKKKATSDTKESSGPQTISMTPPVMPSNSYLPSYDATVTMRTSKWFFLLPPILLSIGRRSSFNKPNTTFKGGFQFPYSNDARSVMLEGCWKPESKFYSWRMTWFCNNRSFVGFEASNKRSFFGFVGTPFLTPNYGYFQGPIWKELRSHMILFATLGVRSGDFQFGVHMTWK